MVANVTASQVSYNGGPGGTTATRTAEEKLAAAEPHLAATPRQRQIVAQSAANPELRARTQGAHLAVASTTSAAVATPPGVVKARATAVNSSGARSATPTAPNTTPHVPSVDQRPTARHTAAPARDDNDSAHAAAPKLTRATPAKPHLPKQ